MPVYLRPSSVIDWDDVPSASQYDVALAAAGADLNVGGVAVKEAVSGGSQLAANVLLDGTVPEGNYVIQVRSKDSNGVSEWTAPLAVVVKLGPPPPTNVTVV
jgi:hypothetical protein